MEAHDTTGNDVDPFEGIEPDPLADPMPDVLAEAGVEQGSLGGDNPSELEPVPDVPAQVEELGAEVDAGPEEEPVPPPSLVPDEDEAAAPVAEEESVLPPEEPEVPETPVAESEPDVAPEDPPEVEKIPASRPKSKAKKPASKKDTAIRGYVILREGAEPGQWQEAFQREDADEPYVLEARNGTTALRAAYRMLAEAETEPQDYTLVCIPRKLWNVKKVTGRVHKQTAISVG